MGIKANISSALRWPLLRNENRFKEQQREARAVQRTLERDRGELDRQEKQLVRWQCDNS